MGTATAAPNPEHVITQLSALRSVYLAPRERALKAELAALDVHARRYIELSPFVVLASAGAAGRLDASPRGGAPGFVKTSDAHNLLIPDAPGRWSAAMRPTCERPDHARSRGQRRAAVPAPRRVAIALGVTLIAGCASGPRPPTVPAPLQPPAGQVAFLEARARGVQIYECVPKINLPGSYEWVFRAPEAALTDDRGDEIGRHYAGPTWDAPDGSRVLGEVKVSAPSPDATAIPWLLLVAKATFGRGLFAGTATIQRVATKGGAAPATPCTVDNVHQFARVPYTAVYYFYRPR